MIGPTESKSESGEGRAADPACVRETNILLRAGGVERERSGKLIVGGEGLGYATSENRHFNVDKFVSQQIVGRANLLFSRVFICDGLALLGALPPPLPPQVPHASRFGRCL